MGCCISTSKQPIPAPNGQRRFTKARSGDSNQDRAPPPPPFLEEETVKEVLSETPTLKSSSYPKIDDEEKEKTPKSVLNKIDEEEDKNVDKKPLMAAGEEISEVSEICSLSESVSTTTFTEKREADDGETRQRVDRSPAKLRNRSISGEFRFVGKSPARRGEPSPGRVRMIPGRERHGLVTDGQRRDAGESSGRRSRSPATRTDGGGVRPGLGGNPSSRRTGKSPGRVQSEPNGKTRKLDGANRAPTNESLENPLVSLECFIFL